MTNLGYQTFCIAIDFELMQRVIVEMMLNLK
jgi:hypothetical protein